MYYNSYYNPNFEKNIVDKVLERGQRLRGAMVQSILDNNPLSEVITSKTSQVSVRLDDLPPETNEKIQNFLKGDVMTKEDELEALDTLRSMSVSDLCRTTDKTYRSDGSCDCFTCKDYKIKDLNCDLKRANNPKVDNSCENYLQFVDSLKISVINLNLNDTGCKKVYDSLNKDRVANVTQSYFIKYEIPEILSNQQKTKSKVDSGLDNKSRVMRLCSRGSYEQGNFNIY